MGLHVEIRKSDKYRHLQNSYVLECLAHWGASISAHRDIISMYILLRGYIDGGCRCGAVP